MSKLSRRVTLLMKLASLLFGRTTSPTLYNLEAETNNTSRPIWELHNPVGETPSITSTEVANVILFLASDGARAINGVALPIDKAWGVI